VSVFNIAGILHNSLLTMFKCASMLTCFKFEQTYMTIVKYTAKSIRIVIGLYLHSSVELCTK